MAAPPTHSALTQGRPAPLARQPALSSSSSLCPSGGALAADRGPIGSLVNSVLYPPTVERSTDASHQDQPAEPAFRPHCRDLCCPGDRRPRGVPAHPQSTDRRSSAVSCIARGGEL